MLLNDTFSAYVKLTHQLHNRISNNIRIQNSNFHTNDTYQKHQHSLMIIVTYFLPNYSYQGMTLAIVN